MKYKNTIRAIVVIGAHESVRPFAVTRDFDEDEVKATKELRAAIAKGYLVPWDGKEDPKAPPAAPAGSNAWSSKNQEGQLVSKKVGDRVVEYVVSDADGFDSVGPGADGVVTAMSSVKSADHIEKGVDASRWVNASDAYDRALDKENAEAAFDDEDSLSDFEGERPAIPDAEEEIARDAQRDRTQILVNRGKNGSEAMTVQSIVEEQTTKANAEITKAVTKNVDDNEKVINREVSSRVVDFLAQPFQAKKWVISRETDSEFLGEVSKVTQSENIRSLAEQRMAEIVKKEKA